jgi:hypothetical protein
VKFPKLKIDMHYWLSKLVFALTVTGFLFWVAVLYGLVYGNPGREPFIFFMGVLVGLVINYEPYKN